MSDHVIGLIFFGAIAVGVYVYYRVTQRKARKAAEQAKAAAQAQQPPRVLTGRRYGGIVEEIKDGYTFVRIDVDEGYAYLHMPDRGLKTGDHITIEEYSDGTWDAVSARAEVQP